MADKDKAFEDFLLRNEDDEKQEQQVKDNERLQEVNTERKEIQLSGIPYKLVFEYPDIGISIAADRVVAEFKARELQSNTLLTSKQLKAIKSRPVTVTINGTEKVVGDPEWSAKDDIILEEHGAKINEVTQELISARLEYQEVCDALDNIKKSDKGKRDQLAKRKNQIYDFALEAYNRQLKLKKELLSVQLKEMDVLNGSLEEMAHLEKIKFLAPKCIKKIDDGKESFLWESEEDFCNAKFSATTILSAFSLFLRGGDISFFDVAPEGATS